MLDDYKKVMTVVSIGAASGGVLWYVFTRLGSKRKRQLPTEWEEVGELAQMTIYPLKSAGPIPMTSANATMMGLREGNLADRSFIILNEKGQMVTGREARLLVTVQTTLEDDKFTLTSKEGEKITVDIAEVIKRKTNVTKFTIRGDNVQGIDCGDKVAEWLTKVLYNDTKKVRLIFNGLEEWGRKSDGPFYFEFPHFAKEDKIGYFDESTYMIMTTDSLKDLNSRLSKPIDISFFRPCIVISGSKAFDEDNWEYIKIGKTAIFRVSRPCERCILTTIDPNSGEYIKEHFQELQKYRIVTRPEKYAKQWKLKPIFGVVAGIESEGRVNLGDKVSVNRSKTPHWSV